METILKSYKEIESLLLLNMISLKIITFEMQASSWMGL